MDCQNMKLLYQVPGKKGRLTAPTPKPGVKVTSILIPCNMCMPCRINKTYAMQVRLYHEWLDHRENGVESYFLTLTYRQEKYPTDGYINKRELQLFFKRLRKKGYTFRYFACGEYGESTGRAHYHAIMYGLKMPDMKKYRPSPSGHMQYQSTKLNEIWGNGFVTLSPIHDTSCLSYVNKYVQKQAIGSYEDDEGFKQPAKNKPGREFMLTSRKPGIGRNRLLMRYKQWYNDGYILLPDSQGKRRKSPIPKYYDHVIKEIDPELFDTVQKERQDNRTPVWEFIDLGGTYGQDTRKRQDQRHFAINARLKKANKKQGPI